MASPGPNLMQITMLITLIALLLPTAYARIHFPTVNGSSFLPWNMPDIDVNDQLSQWKQHIAEAIWDKYKGHVDFCVGKDMHTVAKLMRKSFPIPLPVGPPDDAICGNTSALQAHLCTPDEMMIYLKARGN